MLRAGCGLAGAAGAAEAVTVPLFSVLFSFGEKQ